MSQILVRDVPDDVVSHLKERARRNRRSLQAEVRLILEEVALRPVLDLGSFREYARRARLENGPQTTDSVELIREDRER